MESASSNGKNEFAYGTAEHLGYELHRRFGGDVGMWTLIFCFYSDSVAEYLSVVLDRYGVSVGQFVASYLDNFEEMPRLMDKTRQEIILSKLDFDEGTDPDLRRWRDDGV